MAGKTEGNGLIYMVTIGLKDIGVFNNFPDAFKKFWAEILKSMEEGTAWQVLETMHWITRISDDAQLPILIYDARDLAYNIGLMTPNDNPKMPPIVNKSPTIDGWEEMVRDCFVSIGRNFAMSGFSEAKKNLAEILTAAIESESDEGVIGEIRNMIAELEQAEQQSAAEVEEILAKA